MSRCNFNQKYDMKVRSVTSLQKEENLNFNQVILVHQKVTLLVLYKKRSCLNN